MRFHATALLLVLFAAQVHATVQNGTVYASIAGAMDAIESAFDKFGNSVAAFFTSYKFSCSFGTSRQFYMKTCADSENFCLTANISIGQSTILYKDCATDKICNSVQLLTSLIINATSFQSVTNQSIAVSTPQCCKTSRCNNAVRSIPALHLGLLFAPVFPLFMHSG